MVDLPFPTINTSFSTDLVDMFRFGNIISEGYFGIMILIAIFSIIFITTRARPAAAFSTAAFTTSLVSYLLLVLGLVSVPIVISLTLLTGISMFFLFKYND